jgi:hypothetical protein
MALVEIAHFSDLTEAQAAASALRASDIPVLVQNEHWGQSQFYLQLAMGGFALWVPEQEAADAKAFVLACRQVDPSTLTWQNQPGALTGIPLALLSIFLFWLGGWATWGWAVAAVRQRVTPTRMVVVILLTGLAILGYWFVWYLSRHRGEAS